VGHEQNHHSFNHANGLPAALAAFAAVLLGQGERVIEDLRGVFKPDAMLAPIARGFLVVPVEQDTLVLL
jgi:hypothetical protein